jgi:hypothetical protein
MAYADLNPVLVWIASQPETSSHIAIRERFRSEFKIDEAMEGQISNGDLLDFRTPLKPLLSFDIRGGADIARIRRF